VVFIRCPSLIIIAKINKLNGVGVQSQSVPRQELNLEHINLTVTLESFQVCMYKSFVRDGT